MSNTEVNKKNKKRKITEAAKKATKEYVHKNYDQICVKVRKGNREIIKERADEHNQTQNEYFSYLIYNEMKPTKKPQFEPKLSMYLKFVRKLLRREKLWLDVGNTLARCLHDHEITEDEYRAIIFASGVDRNKFDAKMKAAGLSLPNTGHTIK